MNLHILPVNTKVGGSFQHIPDDTLAAGAILHQKLPCVQNQFHLIPDGEVIFIYSFQHKTSFVYSAFIVVPADRYCLVSWLY